MGTAAGMPGMFGICAPAGGGCCGGAAGRGAGFCPATASPAHVTTIATASVHARVATFDLFI